MMCVNFLPKTVLRIFDLAEIAEEEILYSMQEAVRQGQAEKIPQIWSMFEIMQPPPGFLETADWLYRAHCRELLSRLNTDHPKQAVRLLTAAEVAVNLSHASMEAPLSRAGMAVYVEALRRVGEVLGNGAPDTFWESLTRLEAVVSEDWDGQAKEEYRKIAAKGADRTLPSPQEPHPRVLERVFGRIPVSA